MAPPTPARFYELYRSGLSQGLAADAAYGYAALMWWGEHYGITAARITSGNRTIEEQRRLWRNRHRNPYPVARPGTSRHHGGRAFDLPSSARHDIYSAWAHLVGLKWGGTFGTPDPIHYELD